MQINEKIRTLREINNLTQEDMANQLKMSTNGYANIERGETKIHTEKLEQIAQIFGIDAIELMSFGEKNSVFCMVGENNTNNGINLIGSIDSDKLVHEISRLQIQLTHAEQINQHQQEEISQLKKIISLMKTDN